MQNAGTLFKQERPVSFAGRYEDNGETPLYRAGSYVDVYNSPFHVTTMRVKLISAVRNSDGLWMYAADPKDCNFYLKNKVFTANAIERG